MAAKSKMATILSKMCTVKGLSSSFIFPNDFHYLCFCDSTKITKSFHSIHVLKSKKASNFKMVDILPLKGMPLWPTFHLKKVPLWAVIIIASSINMSCKKVRKLSFKYMRVVRRMKYNVTLYSNVVTHYLSKVS